MNYEENIVDQPCSGCARLERVVFSDVRPFSDRDNTYCRHYRNGYSDHDSYRDCYDSDYNVRIELPERLTIGEGERSMLLAFAGKRLELPKDESLWPSECGGLPPP